MDWLENGLGVPTEVDQATNAYRAEMDLLSAFLAECCIQTPTARVSMQNLYSSYQDWCGHNGEQPLQSRALSTRLKEQGFRSAKSTGGVYHWLGLGLLGDPSSGGAGGGRRSEVSGTEQIGQPELPDPCADSLPSKSPLEDRLAGFDDPIPATQDPRPDSVSPELRDEPPVQWPASTDGVRPRRPSPYARTPVSRRRQIEGRCLRQLKS